MKLTISLTKLGNQQDHLAIMISNVEMVYLILILAVLTRLALTTLLVANRNHFKIQSTDSRIGDPCYKDADCEKGNCTSGICRGVPENSYCGYSSCTFFPCKEYDCDMGLYCNRSSVCVPLVGENAVCDGSDSCRMPLECINGVCTKLIQIPLGGRCTKENEYCANSGACINNVCTDVIHKKCSVNTDCPVKRFFRKNDLICKSPTYSGCMCKNSIITNSLCMPSENLPIAYCYGEMQTFYACLGRHNCSSDNDFSTVPSCGSVNCPQEQMCIEKCIFSGGGGLSIATFEACIPSFGSCPSDFVSMSTNVVVNAVVLMALLFVSLF